MALGLKQCCFKCMHLFCACFLSLVDAVIENKFMYVVNNEDRNVINVQIRGAEGESAGSVRRACMEEPNSSLQGNRY